MHDCTASSCRYRMHASYKYVQIPNMILKAARCSITGVHSQDCLHLSNKQKGSSPRKAVILWLPQLEQQAGENRVPNCENAAHW